MSDSPEVRSFGRRRARKLTARQSHLFETLYPTVAAAAPGSQYIDYAPAAGDQIAEIAADLIQPQQRTWLEIGFGGGEHLIWQARQNPDVTIVGCEPFIDGLVKVLSTIDEDGLSNIRLHDDDVRPLLRSMPDDCIDRAFILFPDPWPKRRHSKRRLVNPPLLRELARVMRKGAELRIGTDIADYARSILPQFDGGA